MFKVGDDVIRGTGYRGIVVSVRNRFDSDYPIVVLFENEEEITFTSELKDLRKCHNPRDEPIASPSGF